MRKFLSLLFCLVLAIPAQAWTLLAHGSAIGNAGATVSGQNCAGADLEIVYLSVYGGAAGTAVSDSSSNTWHALTLGTQGQIWYAYNATASGSQSFSVTTSNSQFFGTIYSACFSGSLTSSDPFDFQNNATTSGNTFIQPGSVMPSLANSLIVTGLSSFVNTNTPTIDSGFTITDTSTSGGDVSGGMAYLPQSGGPSPVNPTWSGFSSGSTYGAVIASFKPASGGSSGAPPSFTVLGITP